MLGCFNCPPPGWQTRSGLALNTLLSMRPSRMTALKSNLLSRPDKPGADNWCCAEGDVISLTPRSAACEKLPAPPEAAILRPYHLRCHGRPDQPAGDPFALQSRGSRTVVGKILRRRRRALRHVERRAAREPNEGPASVRNPPRGRQGC